MNAVTVAIRERLEKLTDDNGGLLTPAIVVADARDPDSPLHGQFEWDAKKAAYAHWIDTARRIIRSVRVDVTIKTMSVSTVAYVRDPASPSHDQGYLPMRRVQSDKDLARSVLIDEFSRAASHLRRAREMATALQLSGEVDEIAQRLNVLREIVSDEARA